MGSKIQVAETWFQRVWSEEDEAAIEEMFVPSGTAKGLGKSMNSDDHKFGDHQRIGPPEFTEFHRGLLKFIGNVKIDVTMSMEQDDWLAVLCVLKAKRRGTDEDVQTTGTIFVKIIDDKLVEAYNHFDFMNLFEQLGSLPAATLYQCLCGEKIG